MPETVILNPTPSIWQADIQDSMTPDYGFSRKRTATRGLKKAVGGVPYTRDLGNTGHSFSLSWLGRSWKCVQRLKQFQEQYEDDYFTLIDWDGGGRHYVGRFTTEVSPVETGFMNWSVQGLTFEEIPTVPMLKYPNDWKGDGITLHPVNAFGDQKLACSGAWTQTTRAFNNANYVTMDNAGSNAGDWAQYEYRGYGFRLHMLQGPTFGPCSVYLDGNLVATINCYAAAAMGPQIVVKKENVPLDIHRVKVIMPGPSGSSPASASWFALEVMR